MKFILISPFAFTSLLDLKKKKPTLKENLNGSCRHEEVIWMLDKCQLHLASIVKIGKVVVWEVFANLLMFHLVTNGMACRHETDRLLPKLFNSQERDG